jgi:hypothetical protein
MVSTEDKLLWQDDGEAEVEATHLIQSLILVMIHLKILVCLRMYLMNFHCHVDDKGFEGFELILSKHKHK